MSFEEKVRAVQREAGWSEHTLLGIILDFFWNHPGGKRAQNSLLIQLKLIASRRSLNPREEHKEDSA